MGIFDRFPYSSTHEMNLDFMLGKATEIAEDMQQVTAGMAQVQAGLTAISEKTEQATQAAAQAAASASSIEGSVTAAEEAAEEAQMHNESAQTWANNALTYKADCQRAATEAAASSSSAAQAATAAAASEDTVAQYAQAANASAQSAANNNDSAHQYANQASASASNATFHSSNAQTAATNANTSATNAETAATNAQTAATRTAALKDDCETLHRMCTAAVDQAATEAVNAANSAAQAAATKTDVETLVESLPEDFTDLNNTVNQLSDEIVHQEATLANTSFLKNGNNVLFGNYTLGNLYVSSDSTKASFTLASNVAVPSNTLIHFRASSITSTIPGYTHHNWYVSLYNSSDSNVQNVVITDDTDEFTFTTNATAEKCTVLLQITYSIAESGRYSATAYNLEMWHGKYALNEDMVYIEAPEQNEILPKIVGNANTNQYSGTILMCGDQTGRQYFSSASTSVSCQVFEVSNLAEGDTLHFTHSGFTLDINPSTVSYGNVFLAKFNSSGSTIGYAYFTPDGYYTVETNVVKVIAYVPVNYSISSSSWGIVTTHDVLVTIGDIALNENLSAVISVNNLKKEKFIPNMTISGGMGNIMRVYNPYADKGQNIYSGQLHCHSKFKQNGQWVYYAGSDSGLMEVMAACGYDFATITDYSHNGELTQKPSNTHGMVWLCNGQETAASANSGLTGQHMCVYNCTKVYDVPTNAQPEYVAKLVAEDGCSCDLAHPSWSDLYQDPGKVAKIQNGIRFCEIYDGLNAIGNDDTFPEGKTYDYAWEIMLDNGCVTWGTAVNDSHTGSDADGGISKGCVHVFASTKDAEHIWEALCKGQFVASTNVNARISDISFQDGTLSVATGDENAVTVFKKENGTIVKTQTGSNATYKMQGNEKYVRAIVTLSSGDIVWCQPIINCSINNGTDNYSYKIG